MLTTLHCPGYHKGLATRSPIVRAFDPFRQVCFAYAPLALLRSYRSRKRGVRLRADKQTSFRKHYVEPRYHKGSAVGHGQHQRR
jgi:hypothetical protein